MKIPVVAAIAAVCMAACSPEADKSNPAIATDEAVAEREMSAPAVGESSFTEGQARDRITSAGYSDVTGLMKIPSGAWQGTAMMNGQSATVIVDYQGNVTAGGPTDPAVPAHSTTPTPTTPQ